MRHEAINVLIDPHVMIHLDVPIGVVPRQKCRADWPLCYMYESI